MTKREAIHQLVRILTPAYRQGGERAAEELLSECALLGQASEARSALDLEGSDWKRVVRALRSEVSE